MPRSLPATEATLSAARPLLGTMVAIQVLDPGPASADVLEAAFSCIASIDRRMSFHRHESELSAINREAFEHGVELSASMRRVVRAALALADASEGAFDPSIGAELVRWGHLPAPGDAIPEPGASWRDIRLESTGKLRFARPLWMDLGGIAKGFAVDCAIACLRRAGVRAATVNAGGDLRSFGHEHTVWVRDPAAPRNYLPLLQMRNAALATSAGYFSRHRGRSALVDPAARRSRGLGQSVSVCAPRALWADALTKVVLMAPRCAPRLLGRLHARALILRRDGRSQAIG